MERLEMNPIEIETTGYVTLVMTDKDGLKRTKEVDLFDFYNQLLMAGRDCQDVVTANQAKKAFLFPYFGNVSTGAAIMLLNKLAQAVEEIKKKGRSQES